MYHRTMLSAAIIAELGVWLFAQAGCAQNVDVRDGIGGEPRISTAAKTSVLSEIADKAELSKAWSAEEGASVEFLDRAMPQAADAGWARMTFAAGKNAAVLFDLPRPQFKQGEFRTYMKTPAEKNIWRGYGKLNILCHNPADKPIEFEVDLEDITGFIVGRFPTQEAARAGQMAEVVLKAPAGQSVLSLDLTGKLRTRDDKRWLDLHHIRRVGFRMKAPAESTSLAIGRLWLEGKGGAGEFDWPANAKPCPECAKGAPVEEAWFADLAKRGFTDPAATHCPFCGTQLREAYQQPVDAPGAIKMYPTASGSITTANGGSGDTGTLLSLPEGDNEVDIHHYGSENWECRAFLRFSLDQLPKDANIKTAALRFYNLWHPDYLPRPDWGKPWFPIMQIFAIDDRYDNWDNKVSWMSQPPVDKHLVEGGLYRFIGGSVRWWSYDVTDFVRAKAAGSRTASFALRVATPYPARKDEHSLGHCMRIPLGRYKQADKRPYLYVEIEGKGQ